MKLTQWNQPHEPDEIDDEPREFRLLSNEEILAGGYYLEFQSAGVPICALYFRTLTNRTTFRQHLMQGSFTFTRYYSINYPDITKEINVYSGESYLEWHGISTYG